MQVEKNKQHYKMYKIKKVWAYALISSSTLLAGAYLQQGAFVHADEDAQIARVANTDSRSASANISTRAANQNTLSNTEHVASNSDKIGSNASTSTPAQKQVSSDEKTSIDQGTLESKQQEVSDSQDTTSGVEDVASDSDNSASHTDTYTPSSKTLQKQANLDEKAETNQGVTETAAKTVADSSEEAETTGPADQQVVAHKEAVDSTYYVADNSNKAHTVSAPNILEAADYSKRVVVDNPLAGATAVPKNETKASDILSEPTTAKYPYPTYNKLSTNESTYTVTAGSQRGDVWKTVAFLPNYPVSAKSAATGTVQDYGAYIVDTEYFKLPFAYGIRTAIHV